VLFSHFSKPSLERHTTASLRSLTFFMSTAIELSPEGQKLFEDLYFGSAQKDYGFKRWYPEKEGTLAQYEQALEGWHKLLKEITRK